VSPNQWPHLPVMSGPPPGGGGAVLDFQAPAEGCGCTSLLNETGLLDLDGHDVRCQHTSRDTYLHTYLHKPARL